MFLVGERACIAGLLEIAVHAEQADPVRPFPIVPALGVDHPAIVEAEQEFAGFILQIDEIGDQQLDRGIHFEAGNVMCQGGQGRYSSSNFTNHVKRLSNI